MGQLKLEEKIENENFAKITISKMETNNQKPEAIIRRGKRYQHFMLFLVTSETILAALFLIWSEEVLEFLRSGINWPLESLMITAILTILANLSVFYGFTNREML